MFEKLEDMYVVYIYNIHIYTYIYIHIYLYLNTVKIDDVSYVFAHLPKTWERFAIGQASDKSVTLLKGQLCFANFLPSV